MPAPHARTPRLFVESDLAGGARIELVRDQAHYLLNVMRLKPGDAVIVFNGREGEWTATIAEARRRAATLTVVEMLRPQASPPDIHYCFAPLKRARVDFIAQKATELGAKRLSPILTRHTVAERVKLDRLRANAVEAAEQCSILWVPEIDEPRSLDAFLAARDPERSLIFCDEAASITNPIAALKMARPGPIDVLIGPEGGFAGNERETILRADGVLALSLGPRIMRADTAGVAALTLVQAVLGDWH